MVWHMTNMGIIFAFTMRSSIDFQPIWWWWWRNLCLTSCVKCTIPNINLIVTSTYIDIVLVLNFIMVLQIWQWNTKAIFHELMSAISHGMLSFVVVIICSGITFAIAIAIFIIVVIVCFDTLNYCRIQHSGHVWVTWVCLLNEFWKRLPWWQTIMENMILDGNVISADKKTHHKLRVKSQ